MLTIRALMSDRDLMYSLVLKGGNALQLVYGLIDRASVDLDFSMENDFTPEELLTLKQKIQRLLSSEFEKYHLIPFDIDLKEKPKQGKIKEWKGYLLTFKVVDYELYDANDLSRTRNAAYVIYDNNSTKFQVDISSYEYTKSKIRTEIEGSVIFVYTPEMIVFEKLRALCQSMPEYQKIIPSAKTKGRARDFYDIWNICQNQEIDFINKTELLKEIFDAKKVPLDFLNYFEKYKDLQKEDWVNVKDTIQTEDFGFDHYYEFVMERVVTIRDAIKTH